MYPYALEVLESGKRVADAGDAWLGGVGENNGYDVVFATPRGLDRTWRCHICGLEGGH
jgi:hypothetical protein